MENGKKEDVTLFPSGVSPPRHPFPGIDESSSTLLGRGMASGKISFGGDARHLFLTGPKHVGKSTVLKRLLADRQTPVKGFRTVRQETEGVVTVHMLRLPGPDCCREDNRLFYRRDGTLILNPDDFNRIGGRILSLCRDYPLLVMDELGPAEKDAAIFQQAVRDCLDGTSTVYGVLQQARSDFLREIRDRKDTVVVEVTESNRDDLPRHLREAGW